MENIYEESQRRGVDMKKKLGKPKRAKLIKLMSEERVNWYLVQLDNPAFRMGHMGRNQGEANPVHELLQDTYTTGSAYITSF